MGRESAEALMRAHETAQAELAAWASERRTPRYPQRPEATGSAAIKRDADPTISTDWLDTNAAQSAELLQSALTEDASARSTADVARRLDQFEQRLDGTDDMALGSDREGLKLIDAHVSELGQHFEAFRQQLERLDAMERQIGDLTHKLEDRSQIQPPADQGILDDDAVAALADAIAERTATRIPSSLPAELATTARIDALESSLQDYFIERRHGDEVTGGILRTIEEALVRLIDRVEAMEVVKSAPPAPLDDIEAAERDGMDVEQDRLAEAYAEGARLLGQQISAPMLHADDYASFHQRADLEEPAIPAPQPIAQELARPEEELRKELRASVMRAKLKAQSVARAGEEPTVEPARAEKTEPDRLGHGRARSWTSGASGSHRFSLLLGLTMALLFGTGFIAVDSWMTPASPPSAPQLPAAARPSANAVAPRVGDGNVQAVTAPQPAATPSPSETVTGEPEQSQPAPTRRLQRLQSGTASAARDGIVPVYCRLKKARFPPSSSARKNVYWVRRRTFHRPSAVRR